VSQQLDLAVHYLVKGEYERALHRLREVVHDEPQNASAWSYLGICCAHLGHALEAEDALSRSIALDPQHADSWFHLGVARGQREEWPEAASAYRRAVALEPSDMVAWHRLGVALAESGDETGAVAAFERALLLSRETGEAPLETPALARQVDAHDHEVGEREGAREGKSWLELALSLLSLGEEEAALAAYERAYTLDPEAARNSLFRPMLDLLTAAVPGESDDPSSRPKRPTGPIPAASDYRPETP
jgi:tetratricopeptide (TPR) repeat protein